MDLEIIRLFKLISNISTLKPLIHVGIFAEDMNL